jgi:hypothetical protein
MFTLLNSRVEKVTPELAQQFRAMTPSPTKRELDPARLKHLKQKLLAGLAIPFNWATAKFEGKVFRANGNHSSNVLCDPDVLAKWPEGLVAHIDEYDTPTPDALALLFRQFDDRKSGRSPNDVSGAYQGLIPALHGIPRETCKLGIEGVAWFERYIIGSGVPNGDDVYNMLNREAYHSFLRWCGELFSIKTPELRQTQIVAAMYGTFVASTEARAFWQNVARGGVNYDDTAPETVLDNWLKELKENKDRKRELEIKPSNLYQGCIFAWNASRAAKPVKEIKFDTKKGFYEVAA